MLSLSLLLLLLLLPIALARYLVSPYTKNVWQYLYMPQISFISQVKVFSRFDWFLLMIYCRADIIMHIRCKGYNQGHTKTVFSQIYFNAFVIEIYFTLSVVILKPRRLILSCAIKLFVCLVFRLGERESWVLFFFSQTTFLSIGKRLQYTFRSAIFFQFGFLGQNKGRKIMSNFWTKNWKRRNIGGYMSVLLFSPEVKVYLLIDSPMAHMQSTETNFAGITCMYGCYEFTTQLISIVVLTTKNFGIWFDSIN